MTTEPISPESLRLPPGPEGLEADVPCPRCSYNWRGLTTPRCPECGYTFVWPRVLSILEELRNRPTPGQIALKIGMWLVVGMMFVPLLFLAPDVLIVLGVAGIVIAMFTAFLAVVEMMLVLFVIRDSIETIFVPWWKGVIVSTAVGVLAVESFIPWQHALDRGWDVLSTAEILGLIVIFIGVVAIHYGVVQARMKELIPMSTRRLITAVGMAKLLVLSGIVFLAML